MNTPNTTPEQPSLAAGQVPAKSRGQIAYEAWNAVAGIGQYVPWDRLDPRDWEYHNQFAAEYERQLAQQGLAVDAVQKARAGAFESAIAIARGCQIEYGGGYSDAAKLDAFYHGMRTVENCLRGRNEGHNLQARIAEAMGHRELKREAADAERAASHSVQTTEPAAEAQA